MAESSWSGAARVWIERDCRVLLNAHDIQSCLFHIVDGSNLALSAPDRLSVIF